MEQVLAAATAQRLDVEEQLRVSAEELLRVNTELHGAREQVTELSRVRAELEAASEAEAQRRSELEDECDVVVVVVFREGGARG